MSNARFEPFDCGAQPGLYRALREARARAGEILRGALPQRCALCAAASGRKLVCDACAADLPALALACPVCALPADDHAICGGCVGTPPPFSQTIAALIYAFPVDRLIQRIKYGGNIALVDWAAATLAAAVRAKLVGRSPRDQPRQIVALPLAARASAHAGSIRRAKSPPASPGPSGCRSSRRSNASAPGRRKPRCRGPHAAATCAARSHCANPCAAPISRSSTT